MAENPYKNKKEEFESSISYGASYDYIKMGTIYFWFILGTLILIITLYGLYNMYAYNQFISSQRAAENASFHDMEVRQEQVRRKLNTLGPIEEAEGRFRIPLDSAMTLIEIDYR